MNHLPVAILVLCGGAAEDNFRFVVVRVVANDDGTNPETIQTISFHGDREYGYCVGALETAGQGIRGTPISKENAGDAVDYDVRKKEKRA